MVRGILPEAPLPFAPFDSSSEQSILRAALHTMIATARHGARSYAILDVTIWRRQPEHGTVLPLALQRLGAAGVAALAAAQLCEAQLL